MPYGIDQDEWNAAVMAITAILANRAKTMVGQETISYSDLFSQIHHLIHSSRLTGPQDHRFHHMLAVVSTSEHEAGRGMLSVLVVHGEGDMKPGPGFFLLARQLGHAIDDDDAFWVSEFRKVCALRR